MGQWLRRASIPNWSGHDERPRPGPGGSAHRLLVSPGAVQLRVYREPSSGGDRKERGPIRGWSRKSRVNMIRTFAQLDYNPLVGDGSRLPAMATLTYPGYWETVVPPGGIPTADCPVAAEGHPADPALPWLGRRLPPGERWRRRERSDSSAASRNAPCGLR